MIRRWFRELRMRSWKSRRVRVRRSGKRWGPECLEGRVLLASPTRYTVNLTSDTGAGSGSAGDLAYVVNQANVNTNPAGSLIQFDPNVFDSPQTITLTTTLTLSESSGAEMIEGPVGSPVTLSGNHSVGVVLIDKNVTATLTNLTVTQGYSTSGGGGIANMGTLTMAGDTITSNSAIGYSGGGGGAEFRHDDDQRQHHFQQRG